MPSVFLKILAMRMRSFAILMNNFIQTYTTHKRRPAFARASVAGACALLLSFPLMVIADTGNTNSKAFAEDDIRIDLTATSADDASAFSLNGNTENQAEIVVGDNIAIRSSLTDKQDAQQTDSIQHEFSDNNLDRLMSNYQSQGLKINRLSAAWEGESGTLKVGNDWSNFQDFSRSDLLNRTVNASPLDEKQISKQITWSSRNGFSIALEQPNEESASDKIVVSNAEAGSLQALTEGLPNLILSWHGELADQAGEYQLSVLGRKMELEGEHNDVVVDDSELGWGVKLGGGWWFGDFFAALNVTLGDGIDSLLLKSFGRDIAVSPSGQTETTESFIILPSLNYSIDQNSDFHVSLGRYQSIDSGTNNEGVNTLDAINLGYTWNPWPSTKFEVEVVGKDYDGSSDESDSAEIKFGAEKSF